MTHRTGVALEEAKGAAICHACEDGATVDEVHDTLGASGRMDLRQEEVREFLDGLACARLIYAQGGRSLALALAWRLPEAA